MIKDTDLGFFEVEPILENHNEEEKKEEEEQNLKISPYFIEHPTPNNYPAAFISGPKESPSPYAAPEENIDHWRSSDDQRNSRAAFKKDRTLSKNSKKIRKLPNSSIESPKMNPMKSKSVLPMASPNYIASTENSSQNPSLESPKSSSLIEENSLELDFGFKSEIKEEFIEQDFEQSPLPKSKKDEYDALKWQEVDCWLTIYLRQKNRIQDYQKILKEYAAAVSNLRLKEKFKRKNEGNGEGDDDDGNGEGNEGVEDVGDNKGCKSQKNGDVKSSLVSQFFFQNPRWACMLFIENKHFSFAYTKYTLPKLAIFNEKSMGIEDYFGFKTDAQDYCNTIDDKYDLLLKDNAVKNGLTMKALVYHTLQGKHGKNISSKWNMNS